MFISAANSVHYALRDDNLQNPENTLSYEEKYSQISIRKYCQRFKATDVVTQQVGSISAVVPTIEVFQPELETGSPITASLVGSYTGNVDPNDDRYYFEFDVDFLNYTGKIIQVKVTQGAVIYLSEFLKGEDLTDELAGGGLLKIVYGNSQKASDYTNFTIDYTTGIEFFFYVEAVLRKPVPSGSDDVFVNIDSKTLTEAQIFRARILETEEIPTFLIEKIEIAGKHFYFSINDLQYISESLPNIQATGTNFSLLTWTLTQQDALGITTDNRELGGTSMEPIIVRKKPDITSGAWTFSQPKEYILHVLYASHNASSLADYVLTMGTTIGGTDLIDADMGSVPLSGGRNLLPFIVHEQWDVDKIIYVTITGATAIADIRVNLILND